MFLQVDDCRNLTEDLVRVMSWCEQYNVGEYVERTHDTHLPHVVQMGLDDEFLCKQLSSIGPFGSHGRGKDVVLKQFPLAVILAPPPS